MKRSIDDVGIVITVKQYDALKSHYFQTGLMVGVSVCLIVAMVVFMVTPWR